MRDPTLLTPQFYEPASRCDSHMLSSQQRGNPTHAIDTVVKSEPEDEQRQTIVENATCPKPIESLDNVQLKRRASINASSLSTVEKKKEHYLDADTKAALAKLPSLTGSRWATPGHTTSVTPKTKSKPEGLKVKLASPNPISASTSQAPIPIKQESSSTPSLTSPRKGKAPRAKVSKTTIIKIDHHLTPIQLENYSFPEGRWKGRQFKDVDDVYLENLAHNLRNGTKENYWYGIREAYMYWRPGCHIGDVEAAQWIFPFGKEVDGEKVAGKRVNEISNRAVRYLLDHLPTDSMYGDNTPLVLAACQQHALASFGAS